MRSLDELHDLLEARSYRLAKEALPNIAKSKKPATPFNYHHYYRECETEDDRKVREEYERQTRTRIVSWDEIIRHVEAYILSIFSDKDDVGVEKLLSQAKNAKNCEDFFKKVGTILTTMLTVHQTRSELEQVSENNTSLKQFTTGMIAEMNNATKKIESGIKQKKVEQHFGHNIQEDLAETIDKGKELEEHYLKKEMELEKLLELQRKDFEHSLEELQQRLIESEKVSYTDPLTGAFNRRAYDEKIVEFVEDALKKGDACSFAMIDIDHFKKINDTYGHQVGDQVLKAMANIAMDNIKHADFLARYGGEEFALILPKTTYANAKGLVEAIRQCIEDAEFTIRGNPVKITASFGLAEVLTHKVKKPEDLVAIADKALYKAKSTGRNKVC